MRRKHGGRTATDNFRIEVSEGKYVRSCHTAVDNIPYNDNLESINGAFFLSYGIRIEKSLGWMLMSAIAAVDNR